MLKGIAASQGIALAKVYKLQQPVLNVVKTEAKPDEIEKLEKAFVKTIADIEIIKERASQSLSEEELAIFDAHLMMANDPELKDQIVGMKLEEEKDITVTFPEDYHSEDLKGKEAVFKCTVHAIRAKELPEVDDEFASDVSEKAETLDAYRAEVKAQIKERKENEGKAKKEDQAVEQAVANAEIDLPEPMVDLQAKQMADDFARRIMQQGLSVEQYFQFTGLSEEKMMEELKPQAEKRIRTRLVLEAIVAAENIEVSDERLDEELAKMAESYKMEVEKLKEFMGENEKKQMKEDIAVQDAVTLIVDASVEG